MEPPRATRSRVCLGCRRAQLSGLNDRFLLPEPAGPSAARLIQHIQIQVGVGPVFDVLPSKPHEFFKASRSLLLKFRNHFSVLGFLNCLQLASRAAWAVNECGSSQNWQP